MSGQQQQSQARPSLQSQQIHAQQSHYIQSPNKQQQQQPQQQIQNVIPVDFDVLIKN